jgi:phosphate transport system substrate-binding protein
MVGAAAAVVVLAGCGSDNGASSPSGSNSNCPSGSLKGAGSSFQDPMEQSWIKGYGGECSGVQVTYQAVGSGAGIQQFGNGTIDYAGSDVTMKPEEQTKADQRCGSKAIHLPVTAGGVGVTFNLSGVDSLQLSAPSIAAIFTGKAKTWNAAEIAADNPGVSLPSTTIRVFVRGDDSGTTSVFKKYLKANVPGWTLGDDKKANFPVGTGKPQSAGVAAAVAQTSGGITYVEEAFAEQKKLKLAAVKNGAGKYVALSPDAVSTALATATDAPAASNDLTQKLNFNPTDPSAYPISTVSYVIVCTKYPTAFKNVAALKGYLTYAVADGQSQAKTLGFASLPSALAGKVKASIAAVS